jgi:hypothetical protein
VKACITVDMDNIQDYQSLLTPGAEASPGSLIPELVPRFLDELDRVEARATFFLIGRDARDSVNRSALRAIAERGHEVGNHSFSHPYAFRHLDRAAKVEEIRSGEEAIADIIGERPVGFRTPSGDVDQETLGILREREYLYDSSVIPSPLMIWTFMLYGKLFIKRKDYNLGEFWSVLAPPRPYLPDPARLYRASEPREFDSSPLVEIPFSALPVLRIPFYATLMRMLPRKAFDAAVWLHGSRRPVLHMLFHLIDLHDMTGTALGEAIGRTPGLGVSIERRRAFIAHAFERMSRQGEAVPLRDVAREFLAQRLRDT